MKKGLISLVAVIVMATIMVACKKDEEKRVTGVSLNKTSINLYRGAMETLIPTITPEDAENKSVTWSSDKTNVATVDTEGKVTAVSPGNATITVTTNDGNKTATCQVTVNTKSIVLGTQSRAISASVEIFVCSFSVTTTDLDTSLDKTITFYTSAAGTTISSVDPRVQFAWQTGPPKKLDVVGGKPISSKAGTHYFSLTIDGVRSNIATLTINP